MFRGLCIQGSALGDSIYFKLGFIVDKTLNCDKTQYLKSVHIYITQCYQYSAIISADFIHNTRLVLPKLALLIATPLFWQTDLLNCGTHSCIC